jgi:hypothetical protein
MLSEMSLEMRRSEFETASLVLDLYNRGLLAVDRVEEIPDDAVGSIHDLLATARQRITERRWDAANQAFEKVLALDHLNQDAKKGLISVAEARKKDRILRTVPTRARASSSPGSTGSGTCAPSSSSAPCRRRTPFSSSPVCWSERS